ncbi:beta-N-acetylglucosaminidase domain-containing protein [Bacteroides helcogenes]|uniref:Hyaluronidase n=1 Tax=Bacteroides helcogenes (strain ATCC 35417 / DSM 20613 / JCM 6297 / CCUG 15421 / P 36-108) TaxID=693979 RepID=E6SUN0_BACT6|nr:beta-N-acetylglucosaminidase domain-containing protein [Bacteroides helcogenes]ADV43394.1 Hyaluronidase [Bacteroides helcogenes P 36-108]MDY5238162.1 beta-N-acetylglucosaminidase domain-containing protein [Bacteroides helcogenes]
MDYKKIWIAGIACTCIAGSLTAQETDFDLSAQRSEIQNVSVVPGKKIDHQGIIINPTPQQMTLDKNNRLDISGGLMLNDKQHKFESDLNFVKLQKKGIKLDINFGIKAAGKQGVKAMSGAYSLTIGEKGISIVGYDERGAFYGIQTLRQLTESSATNGNKLPYLTINDYPDLPNRGVVEGFYGTPWSHAVRLSLIDFYGKFKMNTYLYGPKDDPYHSSPNWRLPYPKEETKNIQELVQACQRNRVDFVWAIHPGKDIKWNEEDYQNLINKLNWMYDLGVRAFAVFFDDIEGEGTNPLKQTELLNRLHDDFAKVKGDISSLTVCPTDYSKLWANPTPQGSLAIYGKALNPDIKVFWTGDVVCSDLTRETLNWVNSRIQRPAYYWWNYPVTDYVRHIILQGPVYGLDTTLTAKETCGLISNPMEHGEASKLALYGVADYAWNVADYNPIDNWERGLGELAPKAKEAYRTFAIHSSDTENGYRRDESWETKTFRLTNWTDEAAQALQQEFERVEKAPIEMEKHCTNQALLNELRPWLKEFGKLGSRGRCALELARQYRSNQDNATFWKNFVSNRMNEKDRKAYEAHKSGTMKLQPFYEDIMDDMSYEFFKKLTGKIPMDYKGIGSFGNSNTIQTKLMLDKDTTTYYTSGIGQKANDWIGVDLRAIRSVSEIAIRQGRNSVDDVDYFDHAVLEYSEDGKNWHQLTEELSKQYVIHWKGNAVKARYVRLKRLDSQRTNYASVRTFEVNPLRVSNLGFRLNADNAQEALLAFDNNPNSSFTMRDSLVFEVPQGIKSYVLLLNRPAECLKLKQLDTKGILVSEISITSPFTKIELAPNTTEIKIEGMAEIVEIIANPQ